MTTKITASRTELWYNQDSAPERPNTNKYFRPKKLSRGHKQSEMTAYILITSHKSNLRRKMSFFCLLSIILSARLYFPLIKALFQSSDSSVRKSSVFHSLQVEIYKWTENFNFQKSDRIKKWTISKFNTTQFHLLWSFDFRPTVRRIDENAGFCSLLKIWRPKTTLKSKLNIPKRQMGFKWIRTRIIDIVCTNFRAKVYLRLAGSWI